MSKKHPIISVTGSSGSGTTTVKSTFEQIFTREHIAAAFIDGDAFHQYGRVEMKEVMKAAAEKGNNHFSHFGPEANCLDKLAEAFRAFSATGTATTRHYVHNDIEAEQYGAPSGTFTPWKETSKDAELLFYEGLHGAVCTDEVNCAQHVDLKIGVVPVINLEWIQKISRDKAERGYSPEAVMDTILRRMPDYIRYICPQFTQTNVNFQRVPTVDTSNPMIARWIPTPDESIVVIRFADPHGIDFPYLLSMIHDSFMSRANSIVIPGNKLDIAMQVIFTPMILQLIERKRRAT